VSTSAAFAAKKKRRKFAQRAFDGCVAMNSADRRYWAWPPREGRKKRKKKHKSCL
jgi:hypothetical protein